MDKYTYYIIISIVRISYSDKFLNSIECYG